jgi:plasmid stabilization system protein ParE
MTFRLSAPALRDIDQIWRYIARDNIAAADRVEDAF